MELIKQRDRHTGHSAKCHWGHKFRASTQLAWVPPPPDLLLVTWMLISLPSTVSQSLFLEDFAVHPVGLTTRHNLIRTEHLVSSPVQSSETGHDAVVGLLNRKTSAQTVRDCVREARVWAHILEWPIMRPLQSTPVHYPYFHPLYPAYPGLGLHR